MDCWGWASVATSADDLTSKITAINCPFLASKVKWINSEDLNTGKGLPSSPEREVQGISREAALPTPCCQSLWF